MWFQATFIAIPPRVMRSECFWKARCRGALPALHVHERRSSGAAYVAFPGCAGSGEKRVRQRVMGGLGEDHELHLLGILLQRALESEPHHQSLRGQLGGVHTAGSASRHGGLHLSLHPLHPPGPRLVSWPYFLRQGIPVSQLLCSDNV